MEDIAFEVVGLDACRGGWVAVTLVDGYFDSMAVVTELNQILDRETVAAAGIDIPIGFPEDGRRTTDVAQPSPLSDLALQRVQPHRGRPSSARTTPRPPRCASR